MLNRHTHFKRAYQDVGPSQLLLFFTVAVRVLKIVVDVFLSAGQLPTSPRPQEVVGGLEGIGNKGCVFLSHFSAPPLMALWLVKDADHLS